VVAYPSLPACPRCASTNMTRQPLSGRGTLWTWTVQRFPPKSPPYEGTFRPFAIGYVELPEGVRVEAILDVDEPYIGQPMRLSQAHGVPHYEEAAQA
jgi:uncharacterized OB-fold protein